MTTLKKIASLTALLIAAAMLSRCTPAPSRMITETIYSEALGEERTCCVYLPENFDPDQTYPVVFATDGQVLLDGGYDTLLDELIEKGTIPPVVLIGAYSNENTVSDGMELRYYEYIDSDDATSRSDADAAGGASADPRIAGRFHHHLSYFTSELRDSIFTEYAIRPDTRKILFYGCSNGGDYGLTLYTTQPGELFTDYICLSPVGHRFRCDFLRRDSTPLRSLRQQRERDAGYRRQPAGAARKTGCNQRRLHHRACFRRRPRPGMLEASVCDRPHRPVESIGSASIPQRRNGQNSSLTAGTAGIARQRPSDKTVFPK